MRHKDLEHLRTLFQRYQEFGDKGVASRKFGKTSNRQLPQHLKDKAVTLITQKYTVGAK